MTTSPRPHRDDHPPRRGRPRSADVDVAILDAAVALLGEVGWSAMSMEAVAAAAGVSKPTLYLRHADKAELVAAAFEHLRMGGAPALGGDLRTDLIAQLGHLRAVFARVGMSLTGVCLAEEQHLPDLIAGLRARSLHPGRRLLSDALQAARARGEIAPDADVPTLVEMAFGAYYARHLAGDRFDAGWEARVADATIRAAGAPPGGD